MPKIDPSIIAIGFVNLLATVYSVFSPVVAEKLPDVYLASVGGLWAKYQMQTNDSNEDRDK